jgi:hypothetical protein
MEEPMKVIENKMIPLNAICFDWITETRTYPKHEQLILFQLMLQDGWDARRPMMVEPIDDGLYRCIKGLRRGRMIALVNLFRIECGIEPVNEIPCIVATFDGPLDRLEYRLVETQPKGTGIIRR